MNMSARTTALGVAAITLGTTLGVLADPQLGTPGGQTVRDATATGTEMTAAGSASTSRDAQVRTRVLAIPWDGGQQRFVDFGRKGITPGDLFLAVGMPVFDNTSGKRIGSQDVVELILSARHDGTVTAQTTLRLHGGRIDIDGVIRHTDKPLRMSVTGGTGRFAGVSGQITLLKEDEHRKVSLMRLRLVR
jgi:hypothetical protein